jgi:hypothetical protein
MAESSSSSSSVPAEFTLALSYYNILKDDYYNIFNDNREIDSSSSSNNNNNTTTNDSNVIKKDTDGNVIKKDTDNVTKTDDVTSTNNVDLNISFETSPKKGPFLCGSGNGKAKQGKEEETSFMGSVAKSCIIS